MRKVGYKIIREETFKENSGGIEIRNPALRFLAGELHSHRTSRGGSAIAVDHRMESPSQTGMISNWQNTIR